MLLRISYLNTWTNSLNLHFQLKIALQTPHVSILSFSTNFQIPIIATSNLFISTRFQLCKVKHPQQFYGTFLFLFWIDMHQPTQIRKGGNFWPIKKDAVHKQIALDRQVISGDFSYSNLLTENLMFATLSDWRALLDEFFYSWFCYWLYLCQLGYSLKS